MNTQPKKSNKEIKVLAINTLYEYAKKILDYEKEHFSKFLGVNIFKVDGSIKAKFEHENLTFKGNLPDGTRFDVNYWFTYSYNELKVNVKLCINGGSYDVKPITAFCQYEEQQLTIFKTNPAGQLIETISDVSFLDQRFDLAELTKIAEGIKAKAAEYEAEVKKMNYLFKYVFDIERLTRS